MSRVLSCRLVKERMLRVLSCRSVKGRMLSVCLAG